MIIIKNKRGNSIPTITLLSEDGQLGYDKNGKNLYINNGGTIDNIGGPGTMNTKVDKIEGKQLSTEDFTPALKTKLEGVAAGANVNILEGVKVDGVNLPITSKNVDISTSTFEKIENKLNSIANNPNDYDYPTVKAVKNYVNSSITSAAANYVTSTASGDAFATKASLVNASVVYNQGLIYIVTKNDYAIVLSDESHGNETWRYSYDGILWDGQYKINDSPMTLAQLNAINSGITDLKVNLYDTHLNNTNNPHNVTKTQVGLSNVVNTITRLDTTSSVSPGFGGSTTAIDSITTNLAGLITDINVKTINFPTVKTINNQSIIGSGNIADWDDGFW